MTKRVVLIVLGAVLLALGALTAAGGGAAAVSFTAQVGLTIPHMFAIGAGLLTGGVVLMLLAGLLLVLGIRAQPRHPGAGSPPGMPDQVRSTPQAGWVPQPGTPAHDTPTPASTADP
jgi:hypothetical protein